ncbi:MAG TPA: hypothetical protein VFD58_20655 [Blastocatellia bacterium]|nr:hypothetical protein [Blastocatellia bacterium]
MNCRDFETIVIDLVRHRQMEAAAREQGLAHAEVCARCAARLSAEQSLMTGVRAVIAEIADEQAPAHVEAALLVALRAQTGHKATPAIMPPAVRRRGMQWRPGLARAAAAAILVILVSVTWLKLTSREQKQEVKLPPVKPASPAPQKRAAAPNDTASVTKQTPIREPAQTRHSKTRRGVRQVTAPANEVASQFYPLVEEGELVPLESGQVIRVEVPASTLISLGLPITAEDVSRPVQADLLLGQDGLARAIRFLPQVPTRP